MKTQTIKLDDNKPISEILGALLFECVEMYAPLPPLSTPWYLLVLLSTPYNVVLLV